MGLRGVGGGGLDGLGGRRGLAGPDDTEGEPDLRPLGEDLCSVQSTAGELSLLCLRGAPQPRWGRDVNSRQVPQRRSAKEEERKLLYLLAGLTDG